MQTALRGNVRDAAAWEGLGACYHALGRFTAALKASGCASGPVVTAVGRGGGERGVWLLVHRRGWPCIGPSLIVLRGAAANSGGGSVWAGGLTCEEAWRCHRMLLASVRHQIDVHRPASTRPKCP